MACQAPGTSFAEAVSTESVPHASRNARRRSSSGQVVVVGAGGRRRSAAAVDDVVVAADVVVGADAGRGRRRVVGDRRVRRVPPTSSVGGMITLRLDLPVISTSNCHRLPSSAVAVHVNSVSSAVDSGSSHSASEYRSSPASFGEFPALDVLLRLRLEVGGIRGAGNEQERLQQRPRRRSVGASGQPRVGGRHVIVEANRRTRRGCGWLPGG